MGERRLEKGNGRKETGERSQEKGDRRKEMGERRQDISFKKFSAYNLAAKFLKNTNR